MEDTSEQSRRQSAGEAMRLAGSGEQTGLDSAAEAMSLSGAATALSCRRAHNAFGHDLQALQRQFCDGTGFTKR